MFSDISFQFFHHLFEKIVSENFDKIAIEISDYKQTTCFSYVELNSRANKIAHYLLSKKIKKGNLIGVSLEKSFDLYACFIAIWKIGGIYVPLSPTLTKNELVSRFTESGVSLTLCNTTIAKQFQLDDKEPIILLDNIKETLEKQPINNPDIQLSESDSAYLIFTSGSLGKPKGVMITHKGIVNCYWSHQEKLKVTNTQKVLQLSDIRVDPSIMEAMLAWGNGACLHASALPMNELISELPKISYQNKINVAIMAPSLLNHLVYIYSQNRQELLNKYFKELTHLISATEAIEEKDLKIWQENGTDKKRKTYVGYGPTETTIGATFAEYIDGLVSLGTENDVFLKMRIYILHNERLTRIDKNSTDLKGELCIEGDGLAKGYWSNGQINIEETNKKFIFFEDPENSGKKVRIYKTGDQAEVFEGKIYYLNRIQNSDQLKIRGYWVNTKEVQNKIKRHSSVEEVVVVKNSRRLIAYIVIKKSEEKPSVAELRNLITEKDNDNSPEVPSCFYEITSSQIEKAKNGVLLLKELTPLNLTLAETKPTHVYEEKIKIIWEMLLDYKDIPINIDFYLAGGYSLLLVEMLQKVANSLELKNIYIKDLPMPLTINNMAKFILTKKLYEQSFVLLNPETELNNQLSKLFYLPPLAGGATKRFKMLAEKIGNQFQHYALRTPLLNNNINKEDRAYYAENLSASLAEMAHYVINAMRKIQPYGPYFLCGWSFGGLLASQVAYQLSLDKQEVKFLGIVDSQAPGKLSAMSIISYKERLISIINAIAKDCGCDDIVKDIKTAKNQNQMTLQISEIFKHIENTIKNKSKLSEHEEEFKNRMIVAKQNLIATLNFEKSNKKIIPNAIIYCADTKELDMPHECLPEDWKSYIEEIDSKIVENSTHFSILENNQFIQLFKKDLEKALDIKIWNLPKELSYYVKRNDLTKNLEKQLQQIDKKNVTTQLCKLVTIYGDPGIGKTQFTIHLIHNPSRYYNLRAWFPAETSNKLFAAYMNFAKMFDIPMLDTSEENCARAVIQWLETHPGWLLVYDNVTDIFELEKYLPTMGGDIIITSRNTLYLENNIKIEAFSSVEADVLIKTLLPDYSRHSLDLAKKLNYFPLAISQACSYITQSGTTIADYLELHQLAPKALLTILPNDDLNQNISRCFKINIGTIRHQSKSANSLLNTIAYLDSEEIPYDLLLDKYLIEKKDTIYDSNLALQSHISLLKNYSLVKVNPLNKTISMHRLIQEIVRSDHSREQSQAFVMVAMMILKTNYFKDGDNTLDEVHRCIALIPHLKSVYDFSKKLNLVNSFINLKIFSEAKQLDEPKEYMIFILRALANAYGTCLHDHKTAMNYLSIAWEIACKFYKKENRTLGILLDEMAQNTDSNIIGLKKQRYLHEQALEIFSAMGDEAKADTAVTLHLLASVNFCLNNQKKAIELSENSLKIKNALFGELCPQSTVTLFNLGNIYSVDDEKVNEALKYYELTEKSIVKNKQISLLPVTYFSKAELLIKYFKKEKLTEAKNLISQAIPMMIQLYEEKDVNVINAYQKLAECYALENNTKKEEEHTKLVFKIFQKYYQKIDSLQLAEHYEKIYQAYKEAGNYSVAKIKIEYAINNYRICYGDLHPKTIKCVYYLGVILGHLGDKIKENEMCQQAIDILSKLLNGKYREEAVKILEELKLITKEEKSKLLPTKNVDDTPWENLTTKFKINEKNEENIETIKYIPSQRENEAKKLKDKAFELFKDKKYEEAIKYFKAYAESAMEIHTTKYHVTIATTYFNIGTAYFRINKLEDAMENLKICIEIDEKIYLQPNEMQIKHYERLSEVYKEIGAQYLKKSELINSVFKKATTSEEFNKNSYNK